MNTRILFVLSSLLMASPAAAENLDIGDFAYAGAFRLPEGFAWGARGATYRAAGDDGQGSLVITGHNQALGEWAEVSIPEPGWDDFSSLPVAEVVSPFTEFDGGLMEGEVDRWESRVGDVACIAPRGSQTTEKCYWNVEWWYNVAAVDYRAIGMSEVDGSSPRGMWHVGRRGDPEFHGSRHGSYMFSVPQWFSDSALGGRSIMVGMSREAGCCGASQGPTLFAFQPWDADTPPADEDLDALALVYYPESFPECAGPNVGNPDACHYPDYRACDTWVGGAFVESGLRSAVVLSGVKAYGDNGYGPGDESACDDSQGYHCEPLEAQLVFYSPTQIADVAAGRRAPETVVPYDIWRPEEFLDTDCPNVGGLATDRTGGRFFAIELGHGAENSAVVHVYDLEPAAEDEAPRPTEDPVDEDPTDEDPIDEDPIDEDPIDEEPVDEEPFGEEPFGEELEPGVSGLEGGCSLTSTRPARSPLSRLMALLP